ncbi:MAG: hypothetical protein JHD16_19250 [Solirubrobacteraceae bacterium]|nr:hypothetical protein [Solirubrobacteraceae bacterium]
MSASPPTFVSPHEVPRIPEMPSAERRRNVRIICVVVLVAWLLAFWIGFELQIDALIILASLPLLLAGYSRWVSAERRALGWWVVKSAWLGERAKPPRGIVAAVELHERWQREDAERQAAELAQAQASQATHRQAAEVQSRRVAVQYWVEDGLVPADAPRPDLVVPGGAVHHDAQLTVGEADAVAGATGAEGPASWAHLAPADLSADLSGFMAQRAAHRDSIGRRLKERGVLRDGPDGIEIAPEWLPLLGVAFFARRSVMISWNAGGGIELLRALMVPGHTVEQRCSAHADGGSEDAERRLAEALLRDPSQHVHQLRRTTPEAIVDAALTGLPGLDVPLPSGEPSWMHVGIWDGDDWVVMRDGSGYSVAKLGSEPEPDRRAMPVSALRDWMLQVVSV